jgi:predicted dehydrogenase
MREPLRIGVIGVGFGQQVHVPAFRADARCQVVAICARSREHAARAAARLGVPQTYGDALQMMASREVDAVSIAVPPALQPELVVAAAEAGKHVFCEKPLAADVAAAERALAAAEKSGVAHAMDFIFPEIPAWQQARSLLAAGTLGALRHAAVSWRVESYAFARGLDSWKMRSTEGGGTLNNFVSHSLYYLEWLLGPVTRIAARFTPRQSAGEARVDAWLELASGCPVTLSVAADAFLGSGHRLEIYGEQGTLRLENRTADYVNGFTLSVGTRSTGAFSAQTLEPPGEPDGRIAAASAIVRRFVDAVLSGSAVEPNLAHGLRVQHLMAAARAADRSGAWQSA